MRTAITFVLVVLLSAQPGAQAQPSDLVGTTFAARVLRVVDGDTFGISTQSGRLVTIRLDAIDTPERGEPFSQRAKQFTAELILQKLVTITGKSVDRNNRLVGRVTVGDQDVSKAVVASGLACHYLKYSNDAELARAEADARIRGLGFWQAGAQRPRCIAINGPQPSASEIKRAGFFGNASSKVFHSAACKNAHCKNCTLRFGDEKEARDSGFRPAGDCLKK